MKKIKDNLSWVEINQKTLLENIAQLRKIVSANVKLMAVVKANAYGHGLKEVAKAIGGKADWFGVNNLEEALDLKKAGVKKPILILGYTPFDQLKTVAQNDFRQVVYNRETVIHLSQLKKEVKIHLKVETGTNRQGITEGEILDFVQFVKKYPKVKIEGLYTHFANLEDSPNLFFAQEQLTVFQKAIDFLKNKGFNFSLKHAASTAATILLPESHFNLVRAGIGLYGLWPSKKVQEVVKKSGLKIDLTPVLSWKTKVAQVKKVERGESVGYGCAFTTKKDSLIAVLPVGYFDGFDRKLSNCGETLVKGEKAPVVGSVCMNMIMVDVTKIPDVKVEDEVVLIGKQGENEITAEEVAEKVGTINYEIVSRINPSLPRIST